MAFNSDARLTTGAPADELLHSVLPKFRKKEIDVSTEYFVYLSPSEGGIERGIVVRENLVALPLKFEFEEASDALGGPGKGAATLSAAGLRLHTGPGAAGIVELEKFSKKTKRGDTGSGHKASGIGTLPDGDLNWRCDDVT